MEVWQVVLLAVRIFLAFMIFFIGAFFFLASLSIGQNVAKYGRNAQTVGGLARLIGVALVLGFLIGVILY